MSAVAQKLITADEFFLMPNPPDGSKQELVRGEIVTMPPPGFRHGGSQVCVAYLIKDFLKRHPIGRVTVESGVRTEREPDSVRGPDVAFWSFERLPPEENPVGYPQVAADLVVEVLSPDNRAPALRRKVREYLSNGVRMVWIVDPDDHTVTIYRKPEEGRVLSEDATITGEDVLPEFSCRIAEFFE